jgi:iron-sulfur cluster assembly accessory protein
MAFKLTPSADKFIRRMLRFSPGASGFRLRVSAGGCSGLTTQFDVEPQPLPDDEVVMIDDLLLFIPKASLALLDGVVVDFLETPTSSGFMIHDPKKSGCGCGDDVVKPTHTPRQLREI